MRKVIMVASAIMMLNLGGCATVTRGTTTAMVINTTPTGARVSTSNGFICESTPCRFDMSRKAEFRVSITKEGYKPFEGSVTHKVASAGGAGFAGNVLVGGLIGMTVDANSGAMNDLYPNPLNVTLAPIDSNLESVQTAEPEKTNSSSTADEKKPVS